MLQRIGHYSFAIFLFHVFFTSSARMLLLALHVSDPLLILALSLPAGLLGPMLIQHLGTRSDLMRNYVLAMPSLRRSAA